MQKLLVSITTFCLDHRARNVLVLMKVKLLRPMNLGTKILILIVIMVIGSSFVVIVSNADFSSTITGPISSNSGSSSFMSSKNNTTIINSVIGSSSNSGSQTQKISLPLYAAPSETWQWNQVDNSTPATGILIINPDFGPGYSLNQGYVGVVKGAQKSGIDVLGYVSTSYADGSISVQTIENQIEEWYSWYQVDGIFFDEVNSTCSIQNIAYYSALYNFTKLQLGPDLVVLNPGAPSQSCYGRISDILVTFEGDYSSYLNNYVTQNWTLAFPPSHFLQIIYNATTLPQMQEALSLATQRHAQWVFVTDRPAIGVNALGTLPYYFCEEAQSVSRAGTSCSSSLGP